MFKLFRKDLILFLNDQRSMVLTFLVPVILITIFAFAYGGIGEFVSDSRSLELLVVDQDNSELSLEYFADLDSIAGLTVISSTFDEATDLVIKGKYAGVLVLKNGFQDSLDSGGNIQMEFLFDKEQELESSRLQSVILSSAISFSGKVEMQNFLNIYQAAGNPGMAGDNPERAAGDRNNYPHLEMTSLVGGGNDDVKLGLIQAIAGTSILMLLFSVSGIGTSILEEKENGTINRLLYSPLNRQAILYSKMLFAFFVGIIQLTIMFLFSWIFLHLNITVNIEALVLMIISTAFAISSIGIFLAAISKSRQQAQSLSTLVILVMSAVGGSMIPLFLMPDIMGKIAIFSVNYWGIQGFYDIFWRSLPVSEILPEVFVLTGTGIVLTIFSIRLFNKSILRLI